MLSCYMAANFVAWSDEVEGGVEGCMEFLRVDFTLVF